MLWRQAGKRTQPFRIVKIRSRRALLSNTQRDCNRFTLSVEIGVRNTGAAEVTCSIEAIRLTMSEPGNSRPPELSFFLGHAPAKKLIRGEDALITAQGTLVSTEIQANRVKEAAIDLSVKSEDGKRTGTVATPINVDVSGSSVSPPR